MQSGKVTVNGAVASEPGTTIDRERDVVAVKGVEVRPAHKGLLLLHKPSGVITSVGDPHGRRTVQDLVSKQYRSYFPVGRLDWESTGLVVMTNDGDLAEHLLHPRYGFDRVYEVTVEGAVPYRVLDQMGRGLMLDDGEVRAKAELVGQDDRSSQLRVTIRVGRNRIIRRLMEKLGFPVLRLHRIAHGPLRLGGLKAGQVRKLSEREYVELRRKIMGG